MAQIDGEEEGNIAMLEAMLGHDPQAPDEMTETQLVTLLQGLALIEELATSRRPHGHQLERLPQFSILTALMPRSHSVERLDELDQRQGEEEEEQPEDAKVILADDGTPIVLLPRSASANILLFADEGEYSDYDYDSDYEEDELDQRS